MTRAFKKDNDKHKYLNSFPRADQAEEGGTAKAGSPCLQRARKFTGAEQSPEPDLVIIGITGGGKKETCSAGFAARFGGRTVVLLATPLL